MKNPNKRIPSKNYWLYGANCVITLVLCSLALLVFLPSNDAISTDAPAPTTRGNPNCGAVALMFNVYSGGEYLDGICDTLATAGMSATFFIGGCWADDNNTAVLKIAEYGFELGNHGYFHLDQDKISEADNRREIDSCDKLLTAILGAPPSRLFAPPSGAYSKTTLSVAEEMGFSVIMWSRDTIDWRDKDASVVLRRATENVAAGELILMHPTAHTLEALPGILDYLKSNGLTAKTVSEVLEA